MKQWEISSNNQIAEMAKTVSELPFTSDFAEKHLDKRAKKVYNDWKEVAENGVCGKVQCKFCFFGLDRCVYFSKEEVIKKMNEEADETLVCENL